MSTMMALLTACLSGDVTVDALIAEIGPQPPEIMAFLHDPRTTILLPTKTRWEQSTVYINQGTPTSNGCGFSDESETISKAGDKPTLAYSLANRFSTCEILMIRGIPE